eukprot:3724992-Prorocentrum_lima.AAC.1
MSPFSSQAFSLLETRVPRATVTGAVCSPVTFEAMVCSLGVACSGPEAEGPAPSMAAKTRGPRA